MKFLFFLILFSPIRLKSQNAITIKSERDVISKWTKAVINLEGQANFLSSLLFVRIQANQQKNPGMYTEEYLYRLQDSLSKIRGSGTVIFFIHKNKHYLISARHVLEDTTAYFQPEIYNIIFLRPNGSDLIDGKTLEPDINFAHTLQITARKKINEIPFIFSSKEIDLAIISLNDIPVDGPRFINTLKNKGYTPITLSDIDTLGNIHTNDNLLAIGFPNFSEVQEKSLPMSFLYWQSFFITIPVITKGLVEDVTPATTSYFTGNIFVYKGFSGGPVIKNNKLVGISRAYKTFRSKLDDSSLGYYLHEKSIFTKTKFIMPMLRALEHRLNEP